MQVKFRAINKAGVMVADTLTLEDIAQASAELARRGLTPVHIEAEGNEGQSGGGLGKISFLKFLDRTPVANPHRASKKHLPIFTAQLSIMLETGTTVANSMTAIKSQVACPHWRELISRISQHVEEGGSMASGVGAFPEVFDPLYVSMISAGETSGNLSMIFKRLADLSNQSDRIRSKVVSAMIYPALLTVIAISVLCVLIFFVLPRFEGVFEEMNVDLPASTKAFLALSHFVRGNLLITLIGLAGIITAIVFWFKSEAGRRFVARFSIRMPIVGPLVSSIINARIFRLIGLLVSANITLVEALELTAHSVKNYLYVELVEEMHENILQGLSMHDVMRRSPLVPSSTAAMVHTGEDNGKIGEIMTMLADYLDDRNDTQVSTLTSVLEPLILIFMGIVIGTVAMSLVLPMLICPRLRAVSMKMNLGHHKSYAIGLDLGGTALRAVQLFGRGDDLHVRAGLEVMPRWSDAKVEIEEAEAEPVDNDGSDILGRAEGVVATVPEVKPRIDKSAIEQMRREKVLKGQLERLARHAAFKGREVVLHCPADRLDMRPIELPSGPEGLPEEAILGALKIQLGGHLGFSVEEAVFDFSQRIYDGERRLLRLMAVTADGQWIKRRIKLIGEAGLQCVGIDAFPCVMSRLVQSSPVYGRAEMTDEGNAVGDTANRLMAILDVGHRRSTLTVAGDEGAVFCRTFSFGGRVMTQKVAGALGLEASQAERLKNLYGLSGVSAGSQAANGWSLNGNGVGTATMQRDGEIARQIHAAVRGDVADFIEQLTRSLNYIINEYRRCRLHKILLCGTGGHTRELDILLAENGEIPIEHVSHPLLDEIVENLPAGQQQSGRWATAVGLALPRGGTA